MPSIKEYNRKLASLKNTSKITRTMKMVSASKLRRAQDAQRGAYDCAVEINKLIARIVGTVKDDSHPLLVARNPVKKLHAVLFTSDKGLCGAFNNNIIRFTHQWVAARQAEGVEVSMSCCGKRGFAGFKDSLSGVRHYENVTGRIDPRNARNIAREISSEFVDGGHDAVVLIYNHFISPLSQRPVVQPLLPLAPAEFATQGAIESITGDFIAEPDINTLLSLLIPRLVNFKVLHALLENAAGEHGARMTAMDNASKNAKELTEKTTLLRNRARQAAITTELIEIISGAEAL